MAHFSYKLRRLHRFLGVSVGVQLLFWTVSGLYFSWTDLDEVHGDTEKRAAAVLVGTDSMGSAGRAIQNLRLEKGSIELLDLRLAMVLGEPFWQLTFVETGQKSPKKYRLADAKTGLLRPPLTEAEAAQIARQAWAGDPNISKIERLEATDGQHEYRENPLPAWAVSFEKPQATTVYVAAELGTVQKFRNDRWRVFDFLWMLHVMDFRTRDDINNWVLRAFSALGLLTVLSGFALFFVSMKKPKSA